MPAHQEQHSHLSHRGKAFAVRERQAGTEGEKAEVLFQQRFQSQWGLKDPIILFADGPADLKMDFTTAHHPVFCVFRSLVNFRIFLGSETSLQVLYLKWRCHHS